MSLTPVENLGLRLLSAKALRELAVQYEVAPPEGIESIDRHALLAAVSARAAHDPRLTREIRKTGIAIKPSFYLMVLTSTGKIPSLAKARHQLGRFLEGTVDSEDSSHLPPYNHFRLEELLEPAQNVIEARFTWQSLHWYWSADDVTRAHVYELRFGFALLDFEAGKGLIACQTQRERDVLARALSGTLATRLSPLVLTQPLLNQIGSFDRVKRAGYLVTEGYPTKPETIVYADDRLSLILAAQSEEESPKSQRKHTFYRIPLGSVAEQGVGVTSDSGKVWIPKETPLPVVRDYGIQLLEKIGRAIKRMAQRGQFSEIYNTLAIPQLPRLAAIRHVDQRNAVHDLVINLANMLQQDEAERPYTVPPVLATSGVPSLFQFPRLELTDPDTGDVAFWKDATNESQSVRLEHTPRGFALRAVPSGAAIDLGRARHPVTHAEVDVDDPVAALHLVPAPALVAAVDEAIRHIATQLPALRKIAWVPFHVAAGRLRIDLDQAHGHAGHAPINSLVSPAEVADFEKLLSTRPKSVDALRIRMLLLQLGEKCVHMSDATCQGCVSAAKFLCLRSLVARYLRDPLVLAHKGIDLVDLQGTLHLPTAQRARVFGFTRVLRGKGSLTARNTLGATLLAQLLSQVDKGTFDTAMVVSPSPFSADLHDRLRLLASVFRKRLLVVDYDLLARMLIEFEAQCSFDKVDPELIYKASRSKLSKRSRLKKRASKKSRRKPARRRR